MPYRLLASRLMPTYGREHPEQPATVLPLTFIIDALTANVNTSRVVNPDKQSKVSALEKQIDEMVYKLYGLTPDEIAIVEGNCVPCLFS